MEKELILKELGDMKTQLEKSLGEKATAEIALAIKGIDAKIEEVKAAADTTQLAKDIATLSADFNAMQKEAKKFAATEQAAKSMAQALNEAYKEKEAEINAILEKGGKMDGPLVFQLKDAITISETATLLAVGSAAHYNLTANTGIISPIRQRILTYLQNVSVGTIALPYANWVEELDEQGTPVFIAEGSDKTQLSVRYEEREAKAKKIAVYGKITTEMLRDLPQLTSYIQTNMMKRMDIATETMLFSTQTGTGNNLIGLRSKAVVFTGGNLAGTVSQPNNFDVINGIVAQVKAANGVVNAVFVENSTINTMLSTKTTYGEYIFPPGVTADAQGNLVAFGVRLIGTNALGAGEFVGGDLSVINVRFRQGATVQIGLDGNDFTKNLKTILMEQELVQFISANDVNVLVKGTFAAAKVLLDSGS
jgi:hypothetical protein